MRSKSSWSARYAFVLMSLVVLTVGCSTGMSMKTQVPKGGTISFEGIPAPTTDADKRKALASPSVTINGTKHPVVFNVLMRSGDVIGGNTFGLIYDQNGSVVVEKDGSRFVSNDNDFSSLIAVDGKLFNITHFESRPGAMYLTELKQDKATGRLMPISTRNIDFSQWDGLWVPCAGSVSPWGTHLGSEEYPPNARAVEEAKSPDKIRSTHECCVTPT